MLVGRLTLMPTVASKYSVSNQPAFNVALAVQPVSIRSTMHLTDLAALAAQRNALLRHPAYVYYVCIFGSPTFSTGFKHHLPTRLGDVLV